ncbi:hypothetical protein UFOVP51_5 [uncultured Caudovirales phage]|uniref:Uncharacterized protein n=1 Tax=uncultured Caudovirales phage TaxID=2100421 RepID=A0A6J5KV47_9CAUD|nr:hypothetical protein UFOVP51_5 [uncultured Caudovirales phage]CAB4240761.1 hypothetical protein UFOVP34_15 [uncultured Caudovirales phage]
MSLFRIERPSRKKEKAIKLMEQEEMSSINILISANLKKRFKIAVLNNNTTVTDIILSYIEKYIKEFEKKEDK